VTVGAASKQHDQTTGQDQATLVESHTGNNALTDLAMCHCDVVEICSWSAGALPGCGCRRELINVVASLYLLVCVTMLDLRRVWNHAFNGSCRAKTLGNFGCAFLAPRAST
jgi:hypothetical protein